MKARTLILVLAILTLAVNLQAADDPLFGVWKLNVAKSKYSPGPAPQSQFLTYEPAGNNAVKLTTDIVDAQGNKLHDGYTAVYDGRVYPMDIPSANADALRLERIDAYTTVRTSTKDGKPTMIQKRTVSQDGKTMTVTATGVNGKGQRLNNVQVYDRQ